MFRFKYKILLYLIIIISSTFASESTEVQLGGLFEYKISEFGSDAEEEQIFRFSIQSVNRLFALHLIPNVTQMVTGDSFNANAKVCNLLSSGVVALFGPQSNQCRNHIHSISTHFQIPQLEVAEEFRSIRPQFLLSLRPSRETFARAYEELIEAWGWTKYVIIYEEKEGLVRLQEILKKSFPGEREATVKKLPSENDYRPLLKEIRIESLSNNIIIDCDNPTKLGKFFSDAREIRMLNQYYKYFITSLDIESLDVREFGEVDLNITSLRLVDPSKDEFKEVSKELDLFAQGVEPGFSGEYDEPLDLKQSLVEVHSLVKTTKALIYDAVRVFAKAVMNLEIPMLKSEISCENESMIFSYGQNIFEALTNVSYKGLSGNIQFDSQGMRKNIQLDVMELSQKGLIKIGTWNEKKREKFMWIRTAEETLKQQEEDLKNKTLIITTKLSNPYCMDPYGNGSFIGYAIDLIELIAQELNFNYEVKLVSDNRYGNPNNKSKHGWDGMIGEILSGEADIAIADLTINYDRERTVDFTMPFMSMGISILYKKPVKSPPGFFSFLDPFNFDIWIYMATAYLVVSLLMFCLARVSDNDWCKPPVCSPDHGKILENQLNLKNSMWFGLGSLMTQGCDILPKSISTRTVGAMWWFFILILVASYTANLAAFLAKEGMEVGIEDVNDLPRQAKVKYGCVGSGTTASFFRDSTFPVYKEIWTNMQNMKPSPFVESTKEGMERVDKSDGAYAFFMESSSIEYVTERECQLAQLGQLLDSKGYGIALRKFSKYRDAFSGKVLELQERGELEKLKMKWWTEIGGGKCEVEADSAGGAKPLTLAHVSGVFLVLFLGCISATVVAIFEFLWKSRKLAMSQEDDFRNGIWDELKFALWELNKEKKLVRKERRPTLVIDSGEDSPDENCLN